MARLGSMTDARTGRRYRASDIVIEDSNLSLAAKGLFSLVGMLGNDCTLGEINERTTDPPEFVAMVIDELLRAGYVNVTDQVIHIRQPAHFGAGG